MYKLLPNNSAILRTTDGACIPPDSKNSDYIAYLSWLSEGNIPTPADATQATELNASILEQISSLEATQHRAVREYISGDATAQERVISINASIAALRSKIKIGSE